MEILRNIVKCKKCKSVIESISEDGLVTCKCGEMSIGGGKKVLFRYGKEENFVELSRVEIKGRSQINEQRNKNFRN